MTLTLKLTIRSHPLKMPVFKGLVQLARLKIDLCICANRCNTPKRQAVFQTAFF